MYTSVFFIDLCLYIMHFRYPIAFIVSNICKRYRFLVHRSVKSQTYSMCISLSMVNVVTFSVVDFRCD